MKRFGYALAALALIALLLLSYGNISSQAYGEEWWNGSWNYRVKLTVNTSGYDRYDWPVEYDVNFTSLAEELNLTGVFDGNSTRVIEVNSSGGVLWEVPSQFDAADDFDPASNAAGTIVFILNGSTASQTDRWFYVYFGLTDKPKADPSYSSEIESSWDGEEFNVTFSNDDANYGFFVFDTKRGENTSGLYQYRLTDTWRFTYSGSGDKTREFVQTTDGQQDFGYNLSYNASITEGPARVAVHQEGYEVYWNQADNMTNMTYLRKTYYFYPNKTWFVIEHEIININDSAVTRGSYAGLSGFDVQGAYDEGSGYKIDYDYSQDPGSSVSGVTAPSGIERGGYAHIWENGTSNFMAGNSTAGGSPNHDRIGINLSMTTIQPGGSIQDRAAMVFYSTAVNPTLLADTMDRLMDNVNVTEGDPEMWVVTLDGNPDHAIYNRNESAVLGANITRDDWNITNHVNATLDMGTPGSSGDDITVELLDDGAYPDQSSGDGFFSAYYNFTDSETPGEWNMTVRAYDTDGTFMNESYYTFNITSEFDVSIEIWNDTGIYRIENATVNVTNFRQDIQIPGATLNCTTAGDQIPPGNVTDNGDGTYIVTFETPFDYGLYPLNCSAEKDGSWGFRVENYTVEAPETNISLVPDPGTYEAFNVTFYGNESFNLKVTLQNLENSTAYDANITLMLPDNLSSNSTFEECGNILISLSCVRDFNITVLNNSAPGEYDIDLEINWTNRVLTTGSNTSSVNVTVYENPVLDVLEENITGILPPGAGSQVIETMLVRSAGNNDTLNITFDPVNLENFSLTFSPPNVSIMVPGEEQPVQIMASVPPEQYPGVYDGWINITSDNGGYELINTTIIVTGTNLTINATPDDYTAIYVTTFSNESFEFYVNVTNTGNTTAFNSYVNVSLPGNWSINSTNHSCGNLTRGNTCMAYFLVNITELTHAGNYTVNATITWEDIGISWRNASDAVNVTVQSNVTLEVIEDGFEKTMEHGTSTILGNMTVLSTGNDDIINVTFNLSQELENFTIGFNQSAPFNMTPGDVRTIVINATIPPGFAPGDYDGMLNITSQNNGYKVVYLNITVSQNGSWSTNTTYCEHAQSPNSGVVCDVLINNTGNILLNFSVTPSGANHSSVSMTSFNLSKQNSTVLTVSYNMGGDAGTGFFLTNYTIDPNESAADPDNVTLEIVLNPFVEPLIKIGVSPAAQLQADSVSIVLNVTSQSGADFDTILLTVERPDGTNDTLEPGFVHQVYWYPCKFTITSPDDMLCYVVDYPVDMGGDTGERGNYTVYAFANDTYDVNSTNTTMFQVYTRYITDLDMPDTTQGSWDSISYRARDYLEAGLPGASVNLSITDPDNRSVYILSGTEYTTDQNGWVSDNVFVIPAHATEGEYTVYSNGSYYDSDVDLWVNNETVVKFNVSKEQTLTGKVAIPSPSYVDNMMTVSVIVLENFNEPVDPDSINLTIYYTEGYTLQPWRELDLTDFDREGPGFYRYSEVLSSVLTGSYLALLRTTLDGRETYDIQPFRIASGGPYDVFLDLADSEVQPGTPLDFDITIWNKGEIDHVDVVTNYWVTGEGQTWDSSSFSTNILGGENKTFSRSAFIYSNQPPGIYTLNAEVIYDPNQPPATANATFLVTGGGEEPPGGGGGGEEAGGGGEGGGGGGPTGHINITDAPDQVGAMIGLPKLFSIEVTAVDGPLSNIWLEFRGMPADWIDAIEPANMTSLGAGQSAVITVQITVPRGESGERSVKVIAHSTESTDDDDFTLMIFTSREDLINFELARLRAKLAELRDRSKTASEAGFDTAEVDDLLDDTEGEIKLAEGYLREELYDAALDSIYTAWKHLDEAEDLLDDMLVGFALPWWLFLIIIFALIIVGLFFLYRKISRNLSILVRGRMSEARQVAGTIRGSGLEVDKLREEKGKTERMMKLLQSQSKQGIISKEAYESLRKRSEQRMAELDKKIREAIKG